MTSAWILSLAMIVTAAPDPSTDADRSDYETARARAGRDADAQVDLALWCESRGLAAEQTRHLTRAVLLDPDHARARGLLGFVKHEGRWMRPDDVSRSVDESAEGRALLSEYLERRAAAPADADGQYKLALWCEEKGLTRPMIAHLRRVVELDPGRDGAWRRLGCKKVGGRWIDPEAEAAIAAAREAQQAADKEWRPRLEKMRNGLAARDKARQADAAAGLAAIEDPRAVPSLWQVFVKGGDERRQRVAIDVLSRIEAPAASAALAMIAVYSPHAPLRSDAALLLQRRDPREYAGLLAGLLRKEVRYTVKPVDGPGSQGELRIEGAAADVVRRYSPPARPQIDPSAANSVDQFGLPTVRIRTGGIVQGHTVGRIVDGPGGAPIIKSDDGRTGSISNGLVSMHDDTPQDLAGLWEKAGVALGPNARAGLQTIGQNTSWIVGTVEMTGSRVDALHAEELVIPVGRMMQEAEAAAYIARRQLAQDVEQIEAGNAPVRETNERVKAILKAAGANDRGDDPEGWMSWAVDLNGYAMASKTQSYERETIIEDVPIAFQPQARMQLGAGETVGFRAHHSCFAAGTMVRTLQGPRAIETVLPGDLVLTVDTTSGGLDYRPVVTAFHNPPNETYRIDLGRESIHPTGIHRLWKAGHGWIMARDVKPGDRLRTLGGVIEVAAVEKESARPVFNLLVDGADDYCVGDSGLIAHDNSFVEPVARPFDLAKAP